MFTTKPRRESDRLEAESEAFSAWEPCSARAVLLLSEEGVAPPPRRAVRWRVVA